MERVNIAIVAYGRIAKIHILAAYMANLKLQLPFELKVTHVITSRPLDIPFSNICVCKTLTEALSTGESIDIIDICNINRAHFDSIKIAVEANKAIYCEKPLTDNLIHSQKALHMVKNQQIMHGVPLVFRYLPCVHMLKEELQKKTLGKFIHYECRYYHSGYLDVEKRNTWRTKGSSGGGASIDLGIHMMDSARFLFGDPIEATNQTENYFQDSETDEIFHAKLSYEQQSSGTIRASRIFSQHKQMARFEVFCEKGSFLCDFNRPHELLQNVFQGDTIIMKADERKDYMKFMISKDQATDYHLDAHMCCLADFARQVHGIKSGQFYANFYDAYIAQCAVMTSKDELHV